MPSSGGEWNNELTCSQFETANRGILLQTGQRLCAANVRCFYGYHIIPLDVYTLVISLEYIDVGYLVWHTYWCSQSTRRNRVIKDTVYNNARPTRVPITTHYHLLKREKNPRCVKNPTHHDPPSAGLSYPSKCILLRSEVFSHTLIKDNQEPLKHHKYLLNYKR